MAGPTVRVRGADRLAATLGRFADDVGRNRPAMNAAGTDVARAAAGNAPRRTGAMAASVASKATDDGATITAGAVYAGPINFGVGPRRGLRGPHNIRRTMWFSSALDRMEKPIVDRVEQSVKTKLNHVRGT